MLPSRRELNFCIITFFKLYPETLEKSSKKALDFEVKIEKNREKNVSKKKFFSIAFFYQFLGGWGRFWEGFGRGLEPLGVSWATFWHHFWRLVFRTLSEGFLEGFLKALGRLWEGFGKAFGQESGLQFCLTFLDVLVCFWARIFRRSRI